MSIHRTLASLALFGGPVIAAPAVKQLFRHLQGTKDLRLVYRGSLFDARNIFSAYTDSAHGDSIDTGRSTSGYLLIIGGGALSWSSRLQWLVAQSTTEVEYIAAVDTGGQAIWMRNLLSEIGYSERSHCASHGQPERH